MTASQQDGGPIPGAWEARLIRLGFVPGQPVYEVVNLQPGEEKLETTAITVEILKRALFESSYSKPLVVPLWHRSPPPDDFTLRLPMVVELAQAIYEPMRERDDSRPIGCWEYPDWYLRGYLHKSPFDATAETIRMHVFLHPEVDTEIIQHYYVQLVPEPTTICDDALLLPEGMELSAPE